MSVRYMSMVTIAMLLFLGRGQAATLDGLTVVIDPGHGGQDYGTRRRYEQLLITESQLTWGVASELAPLLHAAGARVVMTTMQHKLSGQPATLLFGQDTIPTRGADAFRTDGQPPITGDQTGLEHRLTIARNAVQADTQATVVYLSIHFDHVKAGGYPSGARIIYPVGAYDTLLVACLATTLDVAGLLRDEDDRPLIANGRRGLGRHLMVLRQEGDPRRVKEKRRTRLIYNPVPSSVLIELANLPSNKDWLYLQRPGVLRRYAELLVEALLLYQQSRTNAR